MRRGILIVDGKVILGPAKYAEAEDAYKKRIRTEKPGIVEIWASDSSKKIRIKPESVPVAAAPIAKR